MRAHIKLSRKLRSRAKAVGPTEFADLTDTPEVDRLVEQVKAKKLILTITAGRTGTAMMAQLFGLLPDVTATHEGVECYSQALAAAQKNPMAAVHFMIEKKLPAIAALPTPIFSESSHLVSKGFLETYIRLGLYPHLILLHRPLREIALSLLARRCVPGKTKAGINFTISPQDPMTLPFPGINQASDYQRCFWYAIEVERRMRHYATLYATHADRLHAISTTGMTDFTRFSTLLTNIGIEMREEPTFREKFAATTAHTHNPNKMAPPHIADIDAQEEAVWDQITAYEPALRGRVDRWFATQPITVNSLAD